MNQGSDIVTAVKRRDTETVRALLERDPELARTRTPDGSLLLTAIYYGAGEAARLIRERRDDLTIFEAAALGDAARARRLLDADPAQARAFDEQGGTALHLAAFFGHADVVRLLLDAGAEVNTMSRVELPNIPRNMPLHAALAGRRWDVARLLVERGADVNAADSAGLTPLHHAAFGGSPEMIALLLERGARSDVRDARGQTPLDQAERRGHADAARVLREAAGS